MVDPRSMKGKPRKYNFVGSYRHVVDSQSRLQLPRALRKALGPSARYALVVTRGLDGCLAVYPPDEWSRIHDQWMSAVTDADGDARWVRNLIRRVTSHAVETKIDAQGRITLSEDLLRIAEIRGEAMIVGAFEWIEIWSPDRFETEMYEVDDSYDENLGNLMVVHPSKQAAGDG